VKLKQALFTIFSTVVIIFSLAPHVIASTDSPAEKKFNPLSLLKMVEFSGPEAKGFHDCFWIGPVSFESYNMAYPDEGAVYWATRFQMPKDSSHLEIEGYYPNTRYFSFTTYDKDTQPIDALIDTEIVPVTGANPFAQADKSGGKYKLKVMAAQAPVTDRPANTLYLGEVASRNTELPLLLRHYVPAANSDFTGGAGIPQVSLVMNSGERLTGKAMCKAINSPAPGSTNRTVPSVVMPESSYKKLINDADAPVGFPASREAQWNKFWGGRVTVSKLLTDRVYLERAIADSAAGKLPKQSGFYANLHNDYISTLVNEAFGDLVVLRGKLPRTPARGWDITSTDFDMRYWSLCTNESLVTTRYSDCVYDSNVVTDAERNYTIVVSKAKNRPANARPECGITWLDWGASGDGVGDTKQGKLILRNMSGDGFKHSVQNIRSINSAKNDMGPYYPATTYYRKADFEALGCNIPESRHASNQ